MGKHSKAMKEPPTIGETDTIGINTYEMIPKTKDPVMK